eukprot:TRINITY_DN30730_c0_g1_i1.p1 TRINITY_DN30730_c0_g1~~TRINITY_DN30730_c0_g1_i1.p1  ORF type:complete len:882 (-),score=144.59 TRINITY_DN30730_c0_g1_i1:56-2530(-)
MVQSLILTHLLVAHRAVAGAVAVEEDAFAAAGCTEATCENEALVSLLQTGILAPASIASESIASVGTAARERHETAAMQPVETCQDSPKYRDAQGYLCWQWRRYNCSKAVEEHDYEQWQQTQLLQSCPFSCKVCKPNAAELTGVKQNHDGDLAVFLTAMATNAGLCIFFVLVFHFLWRYFPAVYRHNIDYGSAPEIPSGCLGWLRASLCTSSEDAEKAVGLDAAMLLEFSVLAMKLCLWVGVPSCMLIPLHLTRGHVTDVDRLSRIAMANVIEDHPWLYWLHVLCVWNTVIGTCYLVWSAQMRFLPRRYRWLAKRPSPASTTVLVEGISREYRSDTKLKEFFSKIFEGSVESAYVVKKTGTLKRLVQKRDALSEKAMELDLVLQKGQQDESLTSVLLSSKRDEIAKCKSEMDELNQRIQVERAQIKEAAPSVGGVNSHSGFVTFSSPKEARLAQSGLKYGRIASEWVVSLPPEPGSVIWEELQNNRGFLFVKNLIGYALTLVIYIGFVPICVSTTSLAYMLNLEEPFATYWAVFAPTLGLLLFVNFLPTIFLMIFRCFFSLKSDRFAQHQLQVWYFWFQMVFVVLVAAIGQSVLQFLGLLVDHPMSIFQVLSSEMPKTTHFYMSFLVIQWMSHGMNLTRYVNLLKYLAYRKLYDVREAHEKAEPEDQDYYGIGGRSARWTIILLIGVIYGTLSPLMAPLALSVFAVIRVVYGYLIVFAETPKVDLGGVFWVTQLRHLMIGVMIYLVLMIGVLTVRPFSPWPMYFSAPALAVMLIFYKVFDDLEWEHLPLSELPDNADAKDDAATADAKGSRYVQPELEDDAKLS